MCGSRSPSRFKFGPDSSRMVPDTGSASHTDRSERDVECALVGVVHGLEPERTGEHEGEPTHRLLVALHRLDQRVAIWSARYRSGQVERADDVAVAVDGVGVDA